MKNNTIQLKSRHDGEVLLKSIYVSVELLKSKFGFDEAINYKTTTDMKAAVASACPNGVNIYFDNVGGPISDAVIANINPYGRIPVW